jgi:hypothetical protein
VIASAHPMPAFCRHNRFLANCPICSREQAAAAPAAAPRARRTGASTSTRRSGGVRTRQLARDADDGFHSDLVPGVRATADAERLARALADAAARLEYPGPSEAVASDPDLESATRRAFLLALTGEEEPGALTPEQARTATAYDAWAQRAGSQAAAFTGEAAWTPARRFSRLFERLALPGFGRGPRYALLTTLGAADRYPLEAASLHLGGEDPTTVAAKRALVSGDVLLLERRAAALAAAAGIPLAALDRGLADWNAAGGAEPGGAPEPEALPRVRAALGLA